MNNHQPPLSINGHRKYTEYTLKPVELIPGHIIVELLEGNIEHAVFACPIDIWKCKASLHKLVQELLRSIGKGGLCLWEN